MIEEGETIALLYHDTGSGKTFTAVNLYKSNIKLFIEIYGLEDELDKDIIISKIFDDKNDIYLVDIV